MPGIVGVARAGGAHTELDFALGLLCHLPGYRIRAARPLAGVDIGQAWRPDDDPAGDWHSADGVHVFVTGTVVRPGPPPERIRAGDILADYAARGGATPEIYDGSFTIVVADSRRDTVVVCGDRLGSQPVYYASAGGAVAFAPEAKSVFPALDMTPAFDRRGVVSFLACGYCLGRTTLFRDVHMLEPGSTLTISVASGEASERRYFRMVFDPDPALRRRRAAEDAIRAALVQAHRQMVCDAAVPCDVLLSGGLDSRAILAVLDEIGRPPRAAVGWGLRADIAGSDPAIAAAIARSYGVPFRFIRYDTDTFAANARDWCRISELANDNIGWYAEGAPVLAREYRTGAAYMATGDECWGVGGWVRTPEEARDDVLPARLPVPVAGIMARGAAGECASIYDAEIRAVLSQCDSDDLLDQKDFLYIHGRLVRFVYSLGYYKELAVALRRPLTAACILDVMQRVPAGYRVYKNAFVSMMERCYPRVMRQPNATIDSLPDWDYDVRMRPELRALVLEAVADDRLAIPVLGDILDADATRRLRDAFFAERVEPLARGPLADRPRLTRMVPHRIKRGSRTVDTIRRVLGRSTKKRERGAFHTLLAVAQLSLLDEQMQSWLRPR